MRCRFRDPFMQNLLLTEIITYAVMLGNIIVDWAIIPGYYQLLSLFLIQLQKEAPNFTRHLLPVCLFI